MNESNRKTGFSIAALDTYLWPVDVKVPVVNEESGRTERVSQWGLRVEEDVFRRIAADKQDDGIIQRREFGVKRSGQLQPDYRIPTTGAAITRW